MAKLRLHPSTNIGERALTYYGKRPSLGSAVTIYPDIRGNLVARVRKDTGGGKPIGQRVYVWQWLKYSAWFYKIQDAYFLEQYQAQAKGLWLQPRDIFTAALAGRLFYLVSPDGRKIFSTAARYDMSESLDVLAQAPGSLLTRGLEFWQAVPPGLPGQVLIFGNQGLPVWANPDVLATDSSVFFRDGPSLHANLQGGGSVWLASRRMAVRMPGTAFSEVAFSERKPAARQSLLLRFFVARSGTDGGNYDLGVTVYPVNADGSLGDAWTERRLVQAPAVDAMGVFTFGGFGPFTDDHIGVHVRFARYGATPEDSNGSESRLVYVSGHWS